MLDLAGNLEGAPLKKKAVQIFGIFQDLICRYCRPVLNLALLWAVVEVEVINIYGLEMLWRTGWVSIDIIH